MSWSIQLGRLLTYLPHEAAAEVSKDQAPIGRKVRNSIGSKVNWFQIQLFEFQLIWDSSALRYQIPLVWNGCQLVWISNDLVVNWFEIQGIWLSIDLRFKWFGCQLIWISSDVVVNCDLRFHCFQIQLDWTAVGLRFKRFEIHMRCDPSDEIQLISDSVASRINRFASHSIWDSIGLQVNRFEVHWMWDSIGLSFNECENKNQAWKLKKRSFSDRLPSKSNKNYFTSSDPHRDIILLHICHKFWHSLR